MQTNPRDYRLNDGLLMHPGLRRHCPLLALDSLAAGKPAGQGHPYPDQESKDQVRNTAGGTAVRFFAPVHAVDDIHFSLCV